MASRRNQVEESQRLFSDDSSCSGEEEGPEEEEGLEDDSIVNEFAILTAECVAQVPLSDNDVPRVQPPGLQNLQRVDASGKRTKLCPTSCSRPSCNVATLLSFVKTLFPIVHWLPRYQWKSDVVVDLAAGLTLGVMLIPQGMAYAFLAGIHPVYGLYTCLFPAIIYLLMGTSRHMSVGAFSLVSILAGQAITEYMDLQKKAGSGSTMISVNGSSPTPEANTTESGNAADVILYATTLSLLVGILQICMAVCRLGFLASYLSDALISGFTTGAAVQIATSQLSSVLGLDAASMPSGVFKVPKIWVYVLEHITDINVACFIIAFISAAVLIVCRALSIQLQLKFPIPGELLVVTFGTALSWAFSFKELYDVPILNKIPSGLPAPKVPPISATLLKDFAEGTVVVSLIGYAVSVSIALTFANKLSYCVQPNQELLALGVANLFSSFFSCFPSSGSLSRSSVVANIGGKTLLSTLIGSLVVLVVIVALAQLFKTLPTAVLGAIIIIALKGLFSQFTDVKRLWRVNKLDCFVWCCSFLGVVVLNITYGLMVGFASTILTLFFALSIPRCEILERTNTPHGVTYIPVTRGEHSTASVSIQENHSDISASNVRSIKVFRVHGPLLYFNHSYIFSKLSELVCPPSHSDPDSDLMITNYALVKGIVLDASTLTSIDSAGVAALVKTILAYELCGMYLVIANCNVPVKKVLLRSGFQAKCGHKHLLFRTTEDAVRFIHSREDSTMSGGEEGGCLLDSLSRVTGRMNGSTISEMNSVVSDQ